jgi:hypothetical protein
MIKSQRQQQLLCNSSRESFESEMLFKMRCRWKDNFDLLEREREIRNKNANRLPVCTWTL